MPFTPKTWLNDPNTSTPLDATGLGDLETRVTDYADTLFAAAGGGGIIDALFHESGSAAIGTSDPHPAPAAGTLTKVRLRCASAPVGSGLVCEFQVNAVAVSTLTVPAGTTTAQQASISTAVADGDLLTIEFTAVGSTTPAAGVVAQFVGEVSA